MEDYSSYPPIKIVAYSDFYDVPDKRVWGDYWFKRNLTEELLRLGYPLDESHPGILLHLFGEPVGKVSLHTYNMLWIHSHPEWITPDILRKYRKIYCISKHFVKKIIGLGFDAEALMIPTNMRPPGQDKRPDHKIDLLFVGNTRQNKPRRIIEDLGSPPYKIKIWGWGWKGLIPDEWYGGEYYENSGLSQIYSASKIVLNDHHEDMRREGFINPRVLDVLASGGFVVSDSVLGIKESLDNGVAVYESPEELREIIDRYVNDDGARHLLAERGLRAASQYTYRRACSEIIRHIKTLSGKLF